MFSKHIYRLLLGIAIFSLASTTVYAEEYTLDQFDEALEGYLHIEHNNREKAARMLYVQGKALRNPELLKDASYLALLTQNLELAKAASNLWYEVDGGAQALEVVTRIQIAEDGIESAYSLLRHLAELSNPHTVYKVIVSSKIVGDEGIEAMQQSYPLHLRDAQYSAYLAMILLASNQNGQAVDFLDEASKKFPDDVSISFVSLLIADVANYQEQAVNLAKQIARQAEAELEDVVIVYHQWKENLKSPGYRIPINEDIQVAHDSHHSVATLLISALFLFEHGELIEALEVYKSVPRDSPEWFEAVYGQVIVMRSLGPEFRSQILPLITQEIEQAPLELKSRFALLYTQELRATQGYEKSFEFLSDFNQTYESADILYEISIAAERLGKIHDAETALKRFIELEPESETGYNALSYLYAVHNYNIKEAYDLIEKALSINPTSAALIDTHGWVLYRMGDYNNALKRVREAAELIEQPNAEIMAHIGEILWEMDDVMKQDELGTRP